MIDAFSISCYAALMGTPPYNIDDKMTLSQVIFGSIGQCRDHFVYAFSQWELELQCIPRLLLAGRMHRMTPANVDAMWHHQVLMSEICLMSPRNLTKTHTFRGARSLQNYAAVKDHLPLETS